MVNTKNILTTVFLSLFLILSPSGYAATITAKVDRHQINEGESFQLTFEANGSADGSPDFSPLETNFDILSQNQSRNMQIINGSISNKLIWSLTLMPKRKGEMIILPISFGSDYSNSIKINVRSASASPSTTVAKDLFLQVSASPKQAHVQEQVIYTIRVYISTNISNASLSEPHLSDADAVIEKLGEDHRFETEHQGQHYQVVERKYAIFPQQSGKLKIAPMVFNAQLVQSSRYRYSPFPQRGQTKRIQSEAVEINIKPIPNAQKGKTWLPARHIELQEEWPEEPPKFKQGEAITRTLTLGVDGLTAAQLPEIVMATPDGFKTYPDQPLLNNKMNENGVMGIRQEKIAMIATKPGHYVLPEIKIHWWNTKTQKPEVARLAKRKIEVIASADVKPFIDTQQRNKSVDASKNKPTTLSSTNNTKPDAGFWPWLSLILATGWLGTLFVMWYQHRKNTPAFRKQTTPKKDKSFVMSRKQVEKQIKQACKDNDANACKEAILLWGKTVYTDKKLNSLSDLGKHIGGKVADNINKLNQALYHPSSESWQGQGLWDSIQEHNAEKNKTRPKKADALPPLYP